MDSWVSLKEVQMVRARRQNSRHRNVCFATVATRSTAGPTKAGADLVDADADITGRRARAPQTSTPPLDEDTTRELQAASKSGMMQSQTHVRPVSTCPDCTAHLDHTPTRMYQHP